MNKDGYEFNDGNFMKQTTYMNIHCQNLILRKVQLRQL